MPLPHYTGARERRTPQLLHHHSSTMGSRPGPLGPGPSGPSRHCIFDFDWSLINENTDTFVIRALGPGLEIQAGSTLRGRGLGWTDHMDELLLALQQQHGVSVADIAAAVRRVPVHAETGDAVRLAHGAGYSLHIVSDANERYIDSVLDAHQLRCAGRAAAGPASGAAPRRPAQQASAAPRPPLTALPARRPPPHARPAPSLTPF